MTKEGVEILIVEDSPFDLELTMRALKDRHLANRVMTVSDGAAALDFLFARGDWRDREGEALPRVIFLDLKLPKVDGLEVLRQIRESSATQQIPVVIVTSSAEERDRVRSYAIGANSYVVKPIDFENFARTMADVGFYWLAINHSSQ